MFLRTWIPSLFLHNSFVNVIGIIWGTMKIMKTFISIKRISTAPGKLVLENTNFLLIKDYSNFIKSNLYSYPLKFNRDHYTWGSIRNFREKFPLEMTNLLSIRHDYLGTGLRLKLHCPYSSFRSTRDYKRTRKSNFNLLETFICEINFVLLVHQKRLRDQLFLS